MEPFFLSLLALFFSMILSLLFYSLTHSSASAGAAKLPPGWLGWPLIGESLSFLSACRAGHPEKFFFDRTPIRLPGLTDQAVFKTSLLGDPTAVLCGAAGNKFIFSNEDKLVTSWYPRSVVKLFPLTESTATTGSEAKKVRNLLPGLLRPEGLRRRIGAMDEAARRHFSNEWDCEEVVVAARLAKRYTFRVAAMLFASLEDPEEIGRVEEPFSAVAAGLFSIPIDLPGTALNVAVKAVKVVKKELVKAVERRRAELAEGKAGAGEDLLAHMIVTCIDDDGRCMSDHDVANRIIALLVASYETTSAACTFVVKYLAELPQVYEAVFNEQRWIAKSKTEGELLNWDDLQKMKYSWNVAQEVLRIVPPLQGNFREAIADITFGGFSIPKGWKLYWSAPATHKNPSYFPNPDTFDPSRFEGGGPAPHTFVPFGGGPRMCPGKEYARVKILVFMHNLVMRYRWEKVFADDDKIEVVGAVPTPYKGLPVRLYPH